MTRRNTISLLLGVAALGATVAPAFADEYFSETQSFAPATECTTTKTTTTSTTFEPAPLVEQRTILEQPMVIERPAVIETLPLVETAPLATKEKVKIKNGSIKVKEYY